MIKSSWKNHDVFDLSSQKSHDMGSVFWGKAFLKITVPWPNGIKSLNRRQKSVWTALTASSYLGFWILAFWKRDFTSAYERFGFFITVRDHPPPTPRTTNCTPSPSPSSNLHRPPTFIVLQPSSPPPWKRSPYPKTQKDAQGPISPLRVHMSRVSF